MFSSSSWTPEQRQEHHNSFVAEVRALSVLRHPNVTLFMGVCQTGGRLSIVTEFVRRGSLWDVLRNSSIHMDWELRRSIAIDAALGMTYLHHMGFCHGDLKTPNLLVTTNFHVKVADLSMARWAARNDATDPLAAGTAGGSIDGDGAGAGAGAGVGASVGAGATRGADPASSAAGVAGSAGSQFDGVGLSLLWTAPEVLRGDSVSLQACDTYAFGICLWELLTREIPYEEYSHEPIALQVRACGVVGMA